jgi:hypothetical protein
VLRLTLRSAADGRVLARVVDRDGLVFVLDHGEPAAVAEAAQLVLHGGFQVTWQGTVDTALPRTPQFLQRLALHWVSRGDLVFVDEPDWPRRAGVDPTEVPVRQRPGALEPMPLAAHLDTDSLLLDDPTGQPELDGDTEILSRSHLAASLDEPTLIRPSLHDGIDHDAETEERPRRP